ncbi:MAG: tetratricopeptide repeat-containing protein kinase family protein [Planctomycetota bacterium]
MLARGRFRPLEVLGAGGEGEVTRARDRAREREVVLKRAPSSAASRRLLEVHRRLVSLAHPGVQSPEDLVRDDDGSWIAVEPWTPAADLAGLAPGLDDDTLVELVRQVEDALVWLHARGVRHGDVKARNILVLESTPRRARLIDFGLATRADDPAFPGGTPHHFAPEVARGGPHGPGLDWYALGIAVRDLLAGRPEDGPANRALRADLAAWLEPDPTRRLERARERRLLRARPPAIPATPPFDVEAEAVRALSRALERSADDPALALVTGLSGPGRESAEEAFAALAVEARARGRYAVHLSAPLGDRALARAAALELGASYDETARLGARDLDDLGFLRRGRDGDVLFILASRAAAGSPAFRRLVRAVERARGAAPRGPRLRVFVADAAPEGALRLELPAPLEPPECSFLRAVFPDADAADVERIDLAARRLAARAGGDRGRFRRLVTAAADAGVIGHAEGRFRFEEHLLAGLDLDEDGAVTLPPRARRVAAALAANEGLLDREALRHLVGVEAPRLASALAELARAGLVVLGGPDEPVALTAAARGEFPGGPVWPASASGTGRDAGGARELRLRLEAWVDGPDPEGVARHALRALGPEPLGADPEPRRLADLAGRALFTARGASALLEFCEADPRLAGAPALRSLWRARALAAMGDPAAATAEIDRAERPPADALASPLPGELEAEGAFAALLGGRADDAARAVARGRDALAAAAGEDEELRRRRAVVAARLATMGGVAAMRAGDDARAVDELAAAAATWRELGRTADAAAADANLGVALGRAGRAAEAIATLRRAVASLEPEGTVEQLAGALTNLGARLDAQGDLEEALWLHERADSSSRSGAIGSARRSAGASVAIAASGLGRLLPARRRLRRALDEFTSAEDPRAWRIAAREAARLELMLGRRRGFRRACARLASAGPEAAAEAEALAASRQLSRAPGEAPQDVEDVFARPDPGARDIAARWLGLARRIADPGITEDERRRAWTRLLAKLSLAEEDMSERQRTAFRALVVNPVFESLRRTLGLALGETTDLPRRRSSPRSRPSARRPI